MSILANAVRPTLGPGGRNVAVDGRRMAGTKRYGPPEVIAQAQRIIRDMELGDRFQNMGVELLKQMAHQTDEMVGDGTSTAIVLAHAMIAGGIRNIAAGANPMILKRGMEEAARSASQAIRRMARPLQTSEDIRSVMASSASGSEEIAEALIWAVDEIGLNGMMMVERYPKTLGIVVECVHGFQYDRGYLSPYFVTDQREDAVELEEPHVLLVDGGITNPKELIPLFEKLRQLPKHDLLVIAPEVKESALGFLVANNQRGVIRCVAVRPPSYGDVRKEMLQDLGVFTGGVVISQAAGHDLTDATISDLGRAEMAYVTVKDTTIVGGQGDPSSIDGRIAQLKERLLDATDYPQREKLERRIADLAGGLARVRVGGATEVEMDNLVERVESALTSMRAAVEEGIVPGAGVALANSTAALDELQAVGDEATGVAILRDALEEPLRQIAANSGQNGAVVLATTKRLQREHGQEFIGYDALAGDYCDLMGRGIVDPCKTVRTALTNAASCAMMALTVEVIALGPPPPLSPEAKEAARRHLEMLHG